MRTKVDYNKSFEVDSAILYKEDLLKLEKILIEDPNTDLLEISLSFNDTTITVESFGELFAHSNLPESTEQRSMHIRMYRRQRRENDVPEIICSVWLSIFSSFVQCQLSSIEQTWVLGKASQIEKFFSLKKPWYFFLHSVPILSPLFILPLMGGMFIGYIFIILFQKEYYALILPIVGLLAIIILNLLIIKKRLFPPIVLNLHERRKVKFGFYQWCALISALAGILSIVQIIANFFN